MESKADELFEIVLIPGKGLGMVASQNIPCGTRIIAETPLFTIPAFGTPEGTEKLIASKLRQLPKDQQREFLSLHNNFPGRFPFCGTFKTNAIPLGPGSSVGGVYVKCCRVNHSCLPNAHYAWNRNKSWQTIHAMRDIAAGEEITTMYVDGPWYTRRLKLKSKFGFDCNCNLCLLPDEERRASDQRKEKIASLDDLIGDGDRVMANPAACLADVRTLLNLLSEENIRDSRLPRAYYDAFQIVIAHGDQARAKVFAEKALKLRSQCEGDDSPEVLELKLLVNRPKDHRLYGSSSLWKRSIKMIPRNLDGAEFDTWLWKGAGN